MSDRSKSPLEMVEQLSRSEHLLIGAMRAIALGHEECPTVVSSFRRVCRTRGDQTLQSFTVFIKYLALTSPRPLHVHLPNCLRLGPDEAAALAIIAAGQRSLRDKRETELRWALFDLMGDRLDGSLISVVRGLAGILETCGLALPDRRAAPSDDIEVCEPSVHHWI